MSRAIVCEMGRTEPINLVSNSI